MSTLVNTPAILPLDLSFSESQLRARQKLILLLQRAHAGELAAARAYQGHAASWWARRERADIKAIEADEWLHRADIGNMLTRFNASPDPGRERLLWLIGSSIGLLCHIGGWLIPMYGAGVLEQANFEEYQTAAQIALDAGYPDLVEPLLEMAETEWDHEAWFRAQVLLHPLGPYLPLWKALPERKSIRQNF